MRRDPTADKVYAELRHYHESGPCHFTVLAETVGLPDGTVNQACCRLVDRGKAYRCGKGLYSANPLHKKITVPTSPKPAPMATYVKHIDAVCAHLSAIRVQELLGCDTASSLDVMISLMDARRELLKNPGQIKTDMTKGLLAGYLVGRLAGEVNGK